MRIRSHQLIRPLAVAAAIVGLGAPAAKAGHQDLGTYFAPHKAPLTTVEVQNTPWAIEQLLSQERARGVDLCGGLQSCVREFRPTALIPSVTIVEPSAFAWGDAGVGAAGAFGLMLLASGLVIVSRHTHRSSSAGI